MRQPALTLPPFRLPPLKPQGSTGRIATIMADPCTSYWLKDTLRSAFNRDPVDALRDAEQMVAILKLRCREG